jgi:gamma-glutamylcyclotransferase (GGCT)/AIG2-like uncharacterized protein YtfP
LILGLALISTENPNFEMASINFMEYPAMNLFTYGTLRIPSVMYAVTVRRFRGIDAVIKNYARYSVKGESYPGIIPITNAVTDGVVYLDVDELSLKRLDEFEGDLYHRTAIPAETRKGEIYDAETYVIKPEYQACLTSKEWHLNEFFQNHLESFLKNN